EQSRTRLGPGPRRVRVPPCNRFSTGLPQGRLDRRCTRSCLAADQQQVAGVHEQSERLACDEDRVSAMDRVGKECHSACQTKIPEGDRDDAAPLALALDPLPEEAHHEQELSEEANSDPHYFARAERVQVRSCGFEQALHLPRSPTHCGRRGWANPGDTAYRVSSSHLPLE